MLSRWYNIIITGKPKKTLSTSGATRLEKQELHFTYNFGPNFEKNRLKLFWKDYL